MSGRSLGWARFFFRSAKRWTGTPSHSFKKQFASYLEDELGSEDIEEMYTNAYAAIREDPVFKPSEKSQDWKAETQKHRSTRLTHEQRQTRIQAKITAFKEGAATEAEAAGDDDDEDDE